MKAYPDPLIDLIEELASFSGVGRRSATKMAFDILDMEDYRAVSIAKAIVNAKKNISRCKRCHHISEKELCSICSDIKRDQGILTVVDGPRDLIAIERTSEYKGLYHVLHGRISPLEGVRPKDLMIESLIERVQNEDIKEIILANSPTLEGESTALYIARLLEGYNIRVTRIAHGVPIGGELEFADSVTLLKAIQGRKEIL